MPRACFSQTKLRSLPDLFATIDHVLCPGFDPEEYCECGEEDCEIHATGQCGCEAAQSESCCGKDSEDEVVCPGFDDDDYCDCMTDCTEKPEQCACAEAQACCSD